MQSFLDLADLSRDEVVDLLALAQRLQERPNQTRSSARSSACCS
jgi:ornithine carbamoyltransferase